MTKEEKTICRIKDRLARLGPMLPGSISEQWNVCGSAGCQCKDPHHPVKHGPYYQLSFTLGGRSSTLFLKKEDVPEARRRIQRYQQFKTLNTELARAYVAWARRVGLSRRASS
jgi:hypothetical protein